MSGNRNRALAGLAVLALAGLAVGYGFAARARPKPVRIALGTPAPSAAAKTARLMVHVAGAVQRPGVYGMAQGDRVDDAVRAAGGASADADLDVLNLAAKLKDGDKIAIPRRGPDGAPAQASGKAADGRINLNTASASELDSLPGVGPALAERIIAYREQHGGFRSTDDLQKVPGIGAKKYAELAELVTV